MTYKSFDRLVAVPVARAGRIVAGTAGSKSSVAKAKQEINNSPARRSAARLYEVPVHRAGHIVAGTAGSSSSVAEAKRIIRNRPTPSFKTALNLEVPVHRAGHIVAGTAGDKEHRDRQDLKKAAAKKLQRNSGNRPKKV
jgi:hypothetical protein